MVIKQSVHYEIIQNGEIWMDMLEKRNLMAHTYEETILRDSVQKIANEYFKAISQLYNFLQNK